MTKGRRAGVVVAVALVAALMTAEAAGAHAYLIRTLPAASVIVNTAPASVQLTYDEAVEPRFAIVSVTNASGVQETTGPVQRSPLNPDTLVVPVRPRLLEGWYLVYWRAISVDGHPVQGAFTFAIGPNPGPAPQFQVPSVSATAVTPPLLITRWLMFVSVMSAIGLLALRLLIARRAVRAVPELRLRALSIAFTVSAVIGLLAIPLYLDFSTANDSLRSVFDLGALVPLFRVTAFGRAIVDLEMSFALFTLAGWVALRVDRPDRPHRSITELAATTGALLAAAAVAAVPGAAGHPAQTSPRGLTMAFDWIHLVSGSVWLGGLIGLLILVAALPHGGRIAGLSAIVPRFSTVALVSVALIGLTGIGETVDHMPAVNALWETGFGQAILVKTGLLIAVMAIAAGNLLRSRPRLLAARERPELGAPAARLLGALAGGEVALVAVTIFVATILTSLAPPPPAFALENTAVARVGPGRVIKTVHEAGYELQVLVSPNKAATPDAFALRITRGGRPVTGANVTITLNHLEMQMPQQQYQLTERQPGVYSRSAPALVMVGSWGLDFSVTPPRGRPFSALIVDQAGG